MGDGGSVARVPSLTRVHTGLSADPYRSDTIDASLYTDAGRRFSDAASFSADSRGRARVGFPWRTALAAAVLFSVGLTFLLLGVLHFREKDTAVFISFTIIGSLAFLPGSYAAYNLWHALRGTPGFHISQSALRGTVGRFLGLCLTCALFLALTSLILCLP
jgi:Transmembrane proteins 230/134